MIYVKYENGRRLQGILLALGGQWIRVAIQGSDDAVEYRLVRDRWISEDCELVSFQFGESSDATDDQSGLPQIFADQSGIAAADRIM